MAPIIPVILAGGSGKRLWPISLEKRPKQFLPLADGRTTFERTISRVADRATFAPPIIVTNAAHAAHARGLAAAEAPEATFLLEPEGRNSGPAVAAAGRFAAVHHGPDGILLVLASDHVIDDAAAFADACRTAMTAAEDGRIVVFGVAPKGPVPDYGYIRPAMSNAGPVRPVAEFIEKPDREEARRLIADGCLWNSGNVMVRADVLEEELHRHAPGLLAAAARAVGESREDGPCLHLDPDAFAAAPAISIDRVLMEKTRRASVVPVSFQWIDIGTPDAFWGMADKDSGGNAAFGDVELVDSSGCLVHTDNRPVRLVGTRDLLVSVTDHLIVIADKSHARTMLIREAANEKSEKPDADHRRESGGDG